LNAVNIEVRPRPPYEGLDLGFIMAARWFLKLWGLWAVTALPAGCIALLLFYKTPVWGGMLFWWLKPVFETPLLYWVSRKVFNEDPRIQPMLRNMAGILKPQLVRRLTTRRLSLSRSFFMPVMLLENMRGNAYRLRTGILGRNQSAGVVLTCICFLFEGVIYFSVLGLCQLMIPQSFDVSLFDAFFGSGTASQVASHILGIFAMSLVAPFYICAGFALYLSRRTSLEAWDIEMNFKRLIKRKKAGQTRKNHGATLAAILLACGMMLVLGVSDLKASGRKSPQTAKQIITDVLAHEDFGREETVTHWKLKDIFKNREKKNLEFPNFFQAFAEFMSMAIKPLIWAVCGTLAVFMGYYLVKYARGDRGLSKGKKTTPAQELFGLKISADTLPEDIPAETAAFIDTRDFRAALSLLYRGTLYRLVFEELIDIPKSATEGECIRLVEKNTDPETAVFFKSLTGVWLKLAYGHIRPERQTIESLCAQWQGLYGSNPRA